MHVASQTRHFFMCCASVALTASEAPAMLTLKPTDVHTADHLNMLDLQTNSHIFRDSAPELAVIPLEVSEPKRRA